MPLRSIDRLRRSFLTASIFALVACSSPGGNEGVTPPPMQPSSVSRIQFGTSPKGLLYISDSGTNEVETFAWPRPKTGSALGGSFSEPQGECADQSSDVFITNTGDSNVLEYNDRKLTNTLLDKGQYPVGCSFNALDGDLAVSNIISTQDGAGSVSIYKEAAGVPKNIAVTGMQRVYFLQYDGSGDLFAIGEDSSYQPVLAEMKSGSNKIKVICPGLLGEGNIEFPGGIGWDGKYLIFDVGTGVDRIENCKVVGFTRLLGPSGAYILGRQLIAMSSNEIAVYKYPKGGFPIRTFSLSNLSEPIGFAISEDAKGK